MFAKIDVLGPNVPECWKFLIGKFFLHSSFQYENVTIYKQYLSIG